MMIPQLGYGGAEGAFLRLAGFLARYADVTIALMARDYGNNGYTIGETETSLPTVLLDGGRPVSSNRFGKIARWGRMLRRLRELKKRHDVTISFLSGANFLNALAGPKDQTIVSERGSKRGDSGMSRLQRFAWTRLLDPLTYRRSGRIVCASCGLAGEVAAHNPRVAGRTVAIEGTVLSGALIEQAEAPLDDDLSSFGADPLVVAIGRMHRQKGFDMLLRAFALVREKVPDARLLLIGDGPEMIALQSLAIDLGFKIGVSGDFERASVAFAGYRKDPVRHLRLARVVAMPSRYEGLPNALIEALASGLPVLASDCPWGPRSVLAAQTDRLPEFWPVEKSLRLAYGTLMPLPDAPNAIHLWADEICAELQASNERRSPEVCRVSIARFDIAETGPRWLELCQNLAGDLK